jgi:hypothetical protein
MFLLRPESPRGTSGDPREVHCGCYSRTEADTSLLMTRSYGHNKEITQTLCSLYEPTMCLQATALPSAKKLSLAPSASLLPFA